MRILFLTDGFYPFVLGGMQKHSYNLIKQFNALDYRVHVIYTCKAKPSFQSIYNELNISEDSKKITFEYIPFPNYPAFPAHYILESYIYSKRIYHALLSKIHEFDIVYSKGFCAWYSLVNKSAISIPIVSQLHGLEMFQSSFSFKEKLSKLMLRLPAKKIIHGSDYIFSYGGKIKEILVNQNISNHRIFEQYGGVDNFWLEPLPSFSANTTRQFLFVARYEFRKGYHILVSAIEMFKNKKDMHFHIVGEIPEAKKLMFTNVVYHGNLKSPELKTLKEKCDFLLVPSLAEGFPTIVIESMARGLSCIASQVGAIENIVNEENGFLCIPGSKDSLIENINKAYKLDEQQLLSKKKAAYQNVSVKFNWNKIAKELTLHLQQILNDYRQRPHSKKH